MNNIKQKLYELDSRGPGGRRALWGTRNIISYGSTSGHGGLTGAGPAPDLSDIYRGETEMVKNMFGTTPSTTDDSELDKESDHLSGPDGPENKSPDGPSDPNQPDDPSEPQEDESDNVVETRKLKHYFIEQLLNLTQSLRKWMEKDHWLHCAAYYPSQIFRIGDLMNRIETRGEKLLASVESKKKRKSKKGTSSTVKKSVTNNFKGPSSASKTDLNYDSDLDVDSLIPLSFSQFRNLLKDSEKPQKQITLKAEDLAHSQTLRHVFESESEECNYLPYLLNNDEEHPNPSGLTTWEVQFKKSNKPNSYSSSQSSSSSSFLQRGPPPSVDSLYSPQRIVAESDFIKALGKGLTLYIELYHNASSLLLRKLTRPEEDSGTSRKSVTIEFKKAQGQEYRNEEEKINQFYQVVTTEDSSNPSTTRIRLEPYQPLWTRNLSKDEIDKLRAEGQFLEAFVDDSSNSNKINDMQLKFNGQEFRDDEVTVFTDSFQNIRLVWKDQPELSGGDGVDTGAAHTKSGVAKSVSGIKSASIPPQATSFYNQKKDTTSKGCHNTSSMLLELLVNIGGNEFNGLQIQEVRLNSNNAMSFARNAVFLENDNVRAPIPIYAPATVITSVSEDEESEKEIPSDKDVTTTTTV